VAGMGKTKDEVFALPRQYASYVCSWWWTFRWNISVPSSRE